MDFSFRTQVHNIGLILFLLHNTLLPSAHAWFLLIICSSVQFSCSVVSDSLWPRELQHARTPCPSPTPGVYSNSCPSSLISYHISIHSFMKVKVLIAQSCPTLCNPVNCIAPLPMEFQRQDYQGRQPFPSPGNLPDACIEPRSSPLQADFLPSEPPGSPL